VAPEAQLPGQVSTMSPGAAALSTVIVAGCTRPGFPPQLKPSTMLLIGQPPSVSNSV